MPFRVSIDSLEITQETNPIIYINYLFSTKYLLKKASDDADYV